LKSTYKMNILYYTQKYSFIFCSGTYGQNWQYRSSIWLNKYDMKIQVFHNVTPSQQIICYQCLKNHGAYIFSVVVQEQWYHNPSKWNSILVNTASQNT